MKTNKLLLFSILLPVATGIFSSLMTKSGMEAYSQLTKPALSPPAILFPIVWTILYVLMGISSYLILNSSESPEKIRRALTLYGLQLAVNFLWPTFFFNFEWYLFSFFWLLLLWGLVYFMIRKFASVSKAAALLNIPYFLWLTFAVYLNFSVWWLNR